MVMEFSRVMINLAGQVIKKLLLLLIFIWLLLAVPLLMSTPSSEGATILPIATISLDQPVQTADVSPGGTGLVEFTGTVSCELNQFTTAIVSLESEDTWNSSTVVPSAVQFASSDRGDKEFKVSVKAPLGTSRNVVGQVVVTGRVVMYPGSLYGTCQPSDGVVGRIDIAPFYIFSVYTNQNNIETSPGGTVKCDFFIQNKGNTRDTFEISIPDENQLFNNGIQLTPEYQKIVIEEKEEKRVDLTITTSNEVTKNKIYDIKCAVRSLLYFEETGSSLEQYQNFSLQVLDAKDLKDQEPGDDQIELDENDLEYIKNIKDEQTPEFFLPGFEIAVTIFCVFILILISRRSARAMGKY